MDVSTIWDFCGEVVGSIRPRKGYVPATVTRIDNDGTVWVTTGDGTEAPASTCAAGVAVGDVVSVQWSGAQMGVVGNASDPAAGTSTVRAVRKAAESAAKVASGAQAIADAIGQHFFTDDNGVHVSTEKDNPTGERNILMNSLGILLRQGSAWLASFSDSAVAFYDGLGNEAANIVAQFGADGAVIGRAGESHAEIDSDSLQFVDGSGETFFLVNDAAEASEATSLVEIFESTGSSTDNTLTLQHTPTGTPLIYRTDGMPSAITSVSGNVLTLAFALRPGSIAIVPYETTDYHAMNGKTMMLGVNEEVPLAAGAYSASVGTENQPSGDKSMTVGSACRTVDSETFASGGACLAAGEASVAHGLFAKAVGFSSFAQGGNVVAYGPYQHAIGRFNEVDIDGSYSLVIGNGTANNARSNAFAVGWDGTTTHDGDVPWTTFPLASTASHYSSTKPLRYRKWGSMVNLMGAVKPNADVPAGQNYSLTIGTLPEGCRPQEELTQLCQGSGTASWMLRITTGGVVTAERYRTGSGFAVMPAPSGGSDGAWLTMNCTFIV